MKQPLSLSLLIFLMTFSAQAQNRFDLLPYASYLKYDNTFRKDMSLIGGVYGYYGLGLKHSFEGDVAYTKIDFKEFIYNFEGQDYRLEPFTINQLDMTLLYTNYTLTNLSVRLGSHVIISDDSLTNGSLIFFGGLKRYRPYQYNAAIDFYASLYERYAPRLEVYQVSGTFGFYFGNYFTSGNFYAETKGHYIELSDDIGFGGKKFASVEQSLSYYYKNLTLSGFIWAGYQVFGIQKDGFVVYNLAEKHLGAYGASIKQGLSSKSSLKLEVSRGRFKELGADKISTSLKFLVIAGFTL
jgi:hypothetical protein